MALPLTIEREGEKDSKYRRKNWNKKIISRETLD